jgi:C-terminal processing protease CtpA/Prc
MGVHGKRSAAAGTDVLVLLAVGVGCATAPAAQPEGTSRTAVTAGQVYAVLERHGVTAAPADALQSARAFDAVLHALDPGSDCAAQRDSLLGWRAGLGAALRAGDVRFVRAAAQRCAQRTLDDVAAEALALDALAKAFDPHSSYVTAERLAALRAAMHGALPEAAQARGRIVAQGDARVGLVVLPSFYLQSDGRSASRDVRFIVGELLGQGATLIALDLRGNGGGVIAQAAQLAAALGCRGAIAQVATRGNGASELRAPEDTAAYRGPLALLVDAGTAGVSEVFAAAVQDQARGRVAGTRTRGHGSAQTLVLLQSPKGAQSGAVDVTDRYFLRIGSEPIEARGVMPDLALELPAGDPGAEQAIANLLGAR